MNAALLVSACCPLVCWSYHHTKSSDDGLIKTPNSLWVSILDQFLDNNSGSDLCGQ